MIGCTCEHVEGGCLASSVDSQKAKALPLGDPQPQPVHSPQWWPPTPLTVLLFKTLHQDLPLLCLQISCKCTNIMYVA